MSPALTGLFLLSLLPPAGGAVTLDVPVPPAEAFPVPPPRTGDSAAESSREETSSADSIPAKEEANAATLLSLTSDFSGGDSLNALHDLLERGANPAQEDPEGNTPLLYMCRPLEMDYRYRTEPLFQQAVDQAIVALLQHGADALHENRQGCNALFFLQSKPQLRTKLEKEGLLPRELAIRIPHEEGALGRYIQLRVAQAGCSVHEENRSYLSRRYCAPAYERVRRLVQRYLTAESARRVPDGLLKDSLAFLRLASPEQAAHFINELPLWEHGEHFLEEIPELLLRSLDELEWKVAPARLHLALSKLDSMLPKTPDDMIDCNASLPMGHLLDMLARQEGDSITPTLKHYATSPDPGMAYAALRILLRRRGLPLPEGDSLAAALCPEGNTDTLSPSCRNLLECVRVDEAIREAEPSSLDPAAVIRAADEYRNLGLPRHADLLSLLTEDGELIVGKDGLKLIRKQYEELPGMPPRVIMARYILEHPQLFPGQQTP